MLCVHAGLFPIYLLTIIRLWGILEHESSVMSGHVSFLKHSWLAINQSIGSLFLNANKLNEVLLALVFRCARFGGNCFIDAV